MISYINLYIETNICVFVLGPCFVTWILVSFIVKQAPCWGRERERQTDRQTDRQRELLALLGVVAVCVLCLFLMGPWIGEQPMIVAFPGQRSLLFLVERRPRVRIFWTLYSNFSETDKPPYWHDVLFSLPPS